MEIDFGGCLNATYEAIQSSTFVFLMRCVAEIFFIIIPAKAKEMLKLETFNVCYPPLVFIFIFSVCYPPLVIIHPIIRGSGSHQVDETKTRVSYSKWVSLGTETRI